MKSELVRVEHIVIHDRLRTDVSEETVMRIMESVNRVGGLIHPIAVRYADEFEIDGETVYGVPVLVAGRHRLEAFRRLGREHIDCLIFKDEKKAELWEISENLHRSDLTRLQRAFHEAKWVKIVDGDDVQSGHGVQIEESKRADGRGHRKEGGISLAARELPIPGKTEDAKRKHLSRSITIAEKTTPEAADAAQKAGLANSTTALLEIARTAPEKQVKKVREIAKERSAPKAEDAPTFKPKTEAERLAVDMQKWLGTNRAIEVVNRLRTISYTDLNAALRKVVES